jgi:hypothetical protein
MTAVFRSNGGRPAEEAVMQPTAKDLITCKHSVSAVTHFGTISRLGNVCIADFEDWGLMFFDEKEITVIAKKEIKSLVIRPSTEQEDEMLNIPKPEHIPETPPRFKVGQYIVYHNGDRYEIGRVKEITKDGAFVSYTQGTGGSLTLFSDMHPLVNDYCIDKTTLGGDFFGNSEE